MVLLDKIMKTAAVMIAAAPMIRLIIGIRILRLAVHFIK